MSPAAVLEVWVKTEGMEKAARDLKEVDDGLKKAGHQASSATNDIEDTGKRGSGAMGSLKNAAVALGGIAIGAGLVSGAKDAIGAFEESRKVAALTESAIKATGGAANVTAKQVGDLAGAISRKTGIDDEQIQSGSNLLLTFKNVRNEVGAGKDIFDQATRAAVDLSAAGFGSVESASILMGKALNDPIKGITALGRSGVTFSEEQKSAIKALIDTGDAADRLKAQQIILKEVQGQVGGSAEAQASATDKMKVALGNVQEQIGGFLIPVIDSLAGFMAGLFEEMQTGTGTGGMLVDVLGVLFTAATTVGAVIVEIVGFFAEHETVTLALGAALGIAVAAFVALRIAAGIQALIAGVTGAFWAMNAALAANPIILVVAALALLAAALVVAYRESSTLRAVAEAAFRGVATAFSWVLNAAQNVFGWIKANWPLILAILTGPIGLAVRAIITHWDDIKAATSRVWNKIVDVVTGSAGAIGSAISGVFEGGLRIIGRMVERFKQAGVDVVVGIAQGIWSGVSAVADAISGVASGALSRLKGLLGISSPSKEFMKLGKYTAQGFALGITGNAGMVADAIGGLTGLPGAIGAPTIASRSTQGVASSAGSAPGGLSDATATRLAAAMERLAASPMREGIAAVGQAISEYVGNDLYVSRSMTAGDGSRYAT